MKGKLVSLIRINLNHILIITGIILMSIPVYTSLSWRYEQKQMLEAAYASQRIDQAYNAIETTGSAPEREDESPAVDPANNQPEPGNADIENKAEVIPDKNQSVTEPIKRKDYTNGMIVITIPKINLRAGVVKQTTRDYLKKGPGLYEKSPLPDDENGNVCIAAHRNTYGAWFRMLDKLVKGDEITLAFNGLQYLYTVEKVFVVDDSDWSITEPVGYPALTLTTCQELRSPEHRIVARARLKEIID